MKKEKKTLKQIERDHNFETNHKVYCNCDEGHHGVVFYNNRVDKVICSNCGHYIFKDAKAKLKYELKKKGVRING